MKIKNKNTKYWKKHFRYRTKKVQVMESRFKIQTHNIGSRSHSFWNKNIIFGDYKSRLQVKLQIFRNLSNYFTRNGTIHNYDIHFLQEVQLGEYDMLQPQLIGNTPYMFIYKKTGHMTFASINERTCFTVPHGCVIVWNTEVFKYKESFDHFYSNVKKRCTPWIVLKHKETREKFLVVSVHLPVKNSAQVYDNLVDEMLYDPIKKYLPNVIIAGDFNDDYSKVFKKNKNISLDCANAFYKMDGQEVTNFAVSYQDKTFRNTYHNVYGKFPEPFQKRLDFILTPLATKESKIKIGNEKVEYQMVRTNKIEMIDFDISRELRDDFDHMAISCTLDIKIMSEVQEVVCLVEKREQVIDIQSNSPPALYIICFIYHLIWNSS